METGPSLLIIGEWFFLLAVIGLAMWKHEKLMYLGFCIPILIEGYRWFSDYKIIGIILVLTGIYFLYQALRGFLAGDSE